MEHTYLFILPNTYTSNTHILKKLEVKNLIINTIT